MYNIKNMNIVKKLSSILNLIKIYGIKIVTKTKITSVFIAKFLSLSIFLLNIIELIYWIKFNILELNMLYIDVPW